MMNFNSSRDSRYTLIRSIPLPLRKIWRPFDGFCMWLPVGEDYQLIHSFNRIPCVEKPWIISFESILPRTIGAGNTMLKSMLRNRLLLNNCKKIIAMSNYAKTKFIKFNKDWDLLSGVIKKLDVIHPSVPLKNSKPKTYFAGQKLQLVFVGNDFARKGGIVALRLAKKAEKMGLPITIKLVSGMNYGARVYTDCPDKLSYEEDLKLLNLKNVTFHNPKSNQEVIQLLSQSHFQIMPSLDDTYGFSIIEGFSVALPAITTNVCALPEIVRHNQNGYILNLELNEDKNWIHLSRRNNPDYWDILDSTYNNLVEQALQLIVEIVARPEHYELLSAGAIAQALNVHDSRKTSELLDNLYLEAMSG